MTGFTQTFLMATGFLLICLLAGVLVPKVGTAADRNGGGTIIHCGGRAGRGDARDRGSGGRAGLSGEAPLASEALL